MFRIAAALQHSLAAAAHARREARNAAAALVESERKLHALTQHLERAKEEERRAIAQEIHDDVGGALTALKFEVVRLGRELSVREEHAERLAGDPATARVRSRRELTASSMLCDPRCSMPAWSPRSSG